MKRIFSLIIIMCWVFAACQATPEELIVQNKAGDEMQNAINATSGLNESLGNDNNETIIASEHITKSTTNDLETITVNTEADIITPAVNKIPVAVVEKGSFTQAQVDKFIEVLFGDATLYKADSPLTKDEIAEEIIKLKRSATDLNSDMAQSEGITSLAELQERADELIGELEKKHATAPDIKAYATAEDMDINKPILYKGEETDIFVSVIADLGKEKKAGLNLYKSPRGEQLSFSNYDTTGYKVFDQFRAVPIGYQKPEGISMEYEDAKKASMDMLSALNLDEYFMFGNAYIGRNRGYEEGKQYYIFYFERAINGVAVTNDFRDISTPSNDDPAYAEPLRYENLNMWVDDTGVVQVFWNSPISVAEIENDNVEITIDANQAVEVITKQLFFQYADMIYGQAERIEIDIKSIRLGLARIRYRGHPGEYILVPVWDFYGDIKVKAQESSNMASGGYKEVDGMYVYNIFPYQSIGTINALDGSVINRDFGY
jgi:hypothetical protein